MENGLRKNMAVLRMTGFHAYILISLAVNIIYAQMIISGKVMMIIMAPAYSIAIYYILGHQYSSYNVINKDVFNVVPLTVKSKLKYYNFAIISNVIVSAIVITLMLALDYNRICYCIIPDFAIIVSVFYGITGLKTSDTDRNVLYILMGIATSIIFILEGGILL